MGLSIGVIDYGLGNIMSVINMMKRVGAEASVISTAEEIIRADKLILPGVGSFDKGMANIGSRDISEVLEEEVSRKGKPLLGICLGMQLLSRRSEEGESSGLSWIEGDVIRFDPSIHGSGLKIPHMGWNTVVATQDHPIFTGIKQPMRFYFVHSYHIKLDDDSRGIGVTHYGYDFPSVIARDNIIGVQFHPEKSHVYGMRLLKNYCELA